MTTVDVFVWISRIKHSWMLNQNVMELDTNVINAYNGPWQPLMCVFLYRSLWQSYYLWFQIQGNRKRSSWAGLNARTSIGMLFFLWEEVSSSLHECIIIPHGLPIWRLVNLFTNASYLLSFICLWHVCLDARIWRY